jgi:hypothetical protein
VIDTDAHAVGQLDLLQFGVFQARRAGLTAADVWNTYPFEKFRDGLLDARGRRGAGPVPGAPAANVAAKPVAKPAAKAAAAVAEKPAARPRAKATASPAAAVAEKGRAKGASGKSSARTGKRTPRS